MPSKRYCKKWSGEVKVGDPKKTGTFSFRSQCGYPCPCPFHSKAKRKKQPT